MDDLLPIGELARRSGLTISALRFYDREGVLSPTLVDGSTGYRRYSPAQIPSAVLIAGLRRVGMPLAEIREAVEHQHDTELVDGLLDRHVQRLEDGLADARREIARLRRSASHMAKAHVAARDLARAIEAVRFAVSTDDAFPVLAGALVELEGDVCRVVATDRYRMAMHEAPLDTAVDGLASAVAPAAWLDEVAKLLATQPDSAMATVVIEVSSIRVSCQDEIISAAPIVGAYPDYRRLLHDRGAGTGIAAADVAIVDVDAALVALGEDRVLVNHEYLLEALGAAGSAAMLHLDGPIAPLAIRGADGALSLLMPTRPDVDPRPEPHPEPGA